MSRTHTIGHSSKMKKEHVVVVCCRLNSVVCCSVLQLCCWSMLQASNSMGHLNVTNSHNRALSENEKKCVVAVCCRPNPVVAVCCRLNPVVAVCCRLHPFVAVCCRLNPI